MFAWEKAESNSPKIETFSVWERKWRKVSEPRRRGEK